MTGELRVHRRPELARPVLIGAFRGWNDGAQAASLAAGYLAKTLEAERFADVDPEEFFDFQATRPHVSLEEGLTRRIDWPETAFYHTRPDGIERDIVLLLGDVPHTRPSPVTGSASDPELVQRLGLSASRYEGPTGIVGVLHDACKRAEIPSASLWAAVPHYVSLTPSPRAAVALCERLGDLIGVGIDVAELEEAAQTYEEQVSEAVASDEETAAYVDELERRADTIEESTDLPSGDALAAELTRFLREREENGGGEDAAREQ